MLLLVGLGNPGPEHAGNRHNVGFMAVDAIVHRHGFQPFRKRFQGMAAEGTVDGEKILALKPMTYMNLSGDAVAAAAGFYRIAPADIVVIHDEIDLAPFKVRVKVDGGAGGHNGLRDIDAHMGAGYRRVRIGVGHPGTKELVHGHVLRDFAKAERPTLEKLLDAIAEYFPLLVAGKDGTFMSKVALVINPPRPKPPKSKPDADGADGATKDNDGI
ncbi:MAG: aminoacyl-tRNA hydrolase [Candidatus Eiseniibacteriota bacterium]